MGDRAKRPLNQDAVKAADDELYTNHANDPRPNALYDADGSRKPLDANDPDQADLRKEWMNSYKVNGGETEPIKDGGGSTDQVVLPCGQKARVDPLIIGDPVELDESEVEIDQPAENNEEADESESDEDSEEPDDAADQDSEAYGENEEESDGDGDSTEPEDEPADDDDDSLPLKSLKVLAESPQDSGDEATASESDGMMTTRIPTQARSSHER